MHSIRDEIDVPSFNALSESDRMLVDTMTYNAICARLVKCQGNDMRLSERYAPIQQQIAKLRRDFTLELQNADPAIFKLGGCNTKEEYFQHSARFAAWAQSQHARALYFPRDREDYNALINTLDLPYDTPELPPVRTR